MADPMDCLVAADALLDVLPDPGLGPEPPAPGPRHKRRHRAAIAPLIPGKSHRTLAHHRVVSRLMHEGKARKRQRQRIETLEAEVAQSDEAMHGPNERLQTACASSSLFAAIAREFRVSSRHVREVVCSVALAVQAMMLGLVTIIARTFTHQA